MGSTSTPLQDNPAVRGQEKGEHSLPLLLGERAPVLGQRVGLSQLCQVCARVFQGGRWLEGHRPVCGAGSAPIAGSRVRGVSRLEVWLLIHSWKQGET